MENEETQPNLEEMTPEEAKASLGLATRLSEQLLMSQVPQQPVEGMETQESAPEQELELETEEIPPIDPEALKNEVLSEVKKEVKTLIKNEIKKLLDEDDEENDKNETAKDTE